MDGNYISASEENMCRHVSAYQYLKLLRVKNREAKIRRKFLLGFSANML